MKADSGGMATIRMHRDSKFVSEGLRVAVVVIVLRVFTLSAPATVQARAVAATHVSRCATQVPGG